MISSRPKSLYWRAFRDGLPFVMVVFPFSMVFGVVAVEAGMTVAQTIGFSVVVIAGAAQFTALQLIQEEAPTIVVILSALAVNLRVAMYSASLTPYLGSAPLWQRAFAAYLLVDQAFALSHTRFETHPKMTTPQRMAYYFGACTLVMLIWFSFSYVGAAAGTQLPANIPLDFALPIAFLSMVAPALRTLPHVIAAFFAVCASLATAGLPFSLSLVIGGLVGMIAGAQAEVFLHRHKAGQTE